MKTIFQTFGILLCLSLLLNCARSPEDLSGDPDRAFGGETTTGQGGPIELIIDPPPKWPQFNGQSIYLPDLFETAYLFQTYFFSNGHIVSRWLDSLLESPPTQNIYNIHHPSLCYQLYNALGDQAPKRKHIILDTSCWLSRDAITYGHIYISGRGHLNFQGSIVLRTANSYDSKTSEFDFVRENGTTQKLSLTPDSSIRFAPSLNLIDPKIRVEAGAHISFKGNIAGSVKIDYKLSPIDEMNYLVFGPESQQEFNLDLEHGPNSPIVALTNSVVASNTEVTHLILSDRNSNFIPSNADTTCMGGNFRTDDESKKCLKLQITQIATKLVDAQGWFQ